MAIDQLQKTGPVPIDAEGVRKAESHLAAALAHHLGGGDEGPLRGFAVPEVALQIEQPRLAHQIEIEILGLQAHRSPQVRAHGALGIGADQNQAAGRGGSRGSWRGVEPGSHRADVVSKDRAKLIIPHPADEGGPATKLGNAGQGVGRRSTGGFEARPTGGVEPLGLALINEGHGALGEGVIGEKAVVGLDQNINDGVADGHDIKALVGIKLGRGGVRH